MDELSEAELRYYNDLFKICSEAESGGKIPALKATSLFRSANLSNETINKITALVGIPQTALHLSRQQFYGCLKLIAAYQASVPLREEILTSSYNLPLPKFSWIDPIGPTTSSIDPVSNTAAALGNAGTSERNGYVEVKHRSSVASIVTGNHLPLSEPVSTIGGSAQDSSTSTGGEQTNSDQPSTDSEVEHNDHEPASTAASSAMVPGSIARNERHNMVGMLKGGGVVMVGGTHPMGGGATTGGSPEAWSTASDSPTPTNSVAERPWANQNLWQGLVCEEQRQLLGTEEESSDRHSSDEEEEQEIDLEYFYQISQTQKDYYLKQFRTIQPDIHGLVTGPVARVFFEKSRIPIDELRHIWQMCDVTRDGALNLAEFTAAMHLVVLRRNNIPVPASLPPCLLPKLLQHSLLQPGAPSSATVGGSESSTSGSGSSVVTATITGGSATGAASSNGGNITERSEPAEADLLHLESDDNVVDASTTNRKRFVAKDYQRMVPVPDSLAFVTATATTAGTSAAIPASHDSPPSGSVSSGATGTGSGSVALATKGSGSSGSNTSGSSAAVTTAASVAVGGRKTPPNISPPILTQAATQQQNNYQGATKQPLDQVVTPPNVGTKQQKEWNSTTKEWTKFMESPTSNVSSPGPKPVNFDLQRTTQAIVSDPQILHPVPLRVTPVGAEAIDSSSLVYSDVNHGTANLLVAAGQQSDEANPKQAATSLQQQHSHHATPRDSLTNSSDLRAIQRPQPKKPPSKGVGAIPPPPQRESVGGSMLSSNDATMTISLDGSGYSGIVGGTVATAATASTLAKKASVDQQQPPPPLPPPRPSAHRHTRSSSLDLNKLKLGSNAAPLKMPPPPEVPPRVNTPPAPPTDQQQAGTAAAHHHHAFADFTHFPSTTGGYRGAVPLGDPSNITTIHLDAAGNMTHHSTPPRSSGTLPKSLVMHNTPRQSAFEVYRKPLSSQRSSQSPPQQQQPPLVTSRSVECSGGATAQPNSLGATDYDKRISALSDSLRQVRFKSADPPPVMPDVLKQLKEQNLLLLRICNDLSEELLHIQQKREDIRIKIELQEQILGGDSAGAMLATTSGPSSLPSSSSVTQHHAHHAQQQQHHSHHANL
ncbi:uncharacterized protein LOC126572326 [Anopheles aquasalis]|uniref:uncharacterized protein LOC126572326 n=1 Tax=Anopheles aquasalis TaxID=42839 RepID=UPI00215A41B7|nr:uncharacterized protein LOC126572326 [Anopheles aquasalis]